MPATLADFLAVSDTDIPLNEQWPVLARCVQALTAHFNAKIASGTEPSDVLSGMYFAIDGQSTTSKDWRVFVSAADGFFIQENTGNDASPVWEDRLALPLGGGLVSPHATSHQHGGTDEVATATPGANAIPKADGSGVLASGWVLGGLVGALSDTHIAPAAAIAVNKLAALTASRVPVLDGSGFLSASSVTATTLGFLDATSSVQTQLDSKITESVGAIVDADVNAAAAIAYSKLNLAGSIVNADVNAAAAITRSKTASGTAYRILANDVSGVMSENASLGASLAVGTDANGQLATVAGVSVTELGYLSAVTSDIQAQIDGIGGGGDFVLLQTYTPSAVASVDITSIISATYDKYRIAFTLRPATDAVALRLRTDTANGASFDIGGSDYNSAYSQSSNNTATMGGAGADAFIPLTGANIGNATNEGISGTITLEFLGSASMYPVITHSYGFLNTATTPFWGSGMGVRQSAAVINAVQLFFSSGNITSGTVRIYGLANS